METEKPILSTQQSLDIITRMIIEARGNVKRSSIYLVMWGSVAAIANIGIAILMWLDYRHPHFVWLITIPAWIATFVISHKQGREATTRSHLDRVNMYLWYSYGVVVFTLVAFGYKINFQINPVILLVSACPALVSGIVTKYRPLVVGGILFWVFGVICFLVTGPWQNVVGATAVICGHLIPGLMLWKKNNHV
jgi:hypothetical protein